MNTEQLANKLVSWIRDRVLAAGLKGAVVGMSGGVDSSVTAVLCHHALPQSMLGLIMPCHSNRQDEQHARAVAKKFSISTKTVVLDTVFNTLLKAIPAEGGAYATSRLAEANLKARLRMLTLYYHANQLNYMVVGSGNKSELSIGYFTKYGDGGVDILPLGNLGKAQVVELASFLGIPQEIIDKPPSAGLWAGQTDEDELGLSYEELDRYLLTGKARGEIRQKIDVSYTLFFKALSNDTRLRIIDLLKKGPRNATEIGEVLSIEQSMVSHNLACLINCGFVLIEQYGKNKVCSLNEETVLPLLEIIDRHIKEYGKNLEGCEVLKDIRKAIK